MFGYRACCCVSCLLLCILVPINILWPKYLWFRYLVLEELPGTLTSLPPYLNCWIQLSFFLKVLLVFFPATLGIQPSITKMTYSSWLKPTEETPRLSVSRGPSSWGLPHGTGQTAPHLTLRLQLEWALPGVPGALAIPTLPPWPHSEVPNATSGQDRDFRNPNLLST